MKDKNGVEIQVGDWVTWGVQRHAARVAIDMMVWEAGTERFVSLERVSSERDREIISRKVRPRRTLTLSQGLAWLEGQMLLVYGNGGKDWRVRKITGSEGNLVGEGGETLLKAIIAARKALGVK